MSDLLRGKNLTFDLDVKEMGFCGRAGTRTQDLTDVNPVNGNHAHDVILLEVELFNN